MLRLGRSELEARENELTDFLRELTEREARMAEAEAEMARRRQDLGAVELKRAAVERRDRDVAARESLLADLEVEAEQRAAREAPGEPRAEHVELAFVSGPTYRLVERPAGDLVPGATVEIAAEEYVAERIGPSPLPGDRRRCAFVVRSALRRGSDGPS